MTCKPHDNRAVEAAIGEEEAFDPWKWEDEVECGDEDEDDEEGYGGGKRGRKKGPANLTIDYRDFSSGIFTEVRVCALSLSLS